MSTFGARVQATMVEAAEKALKMTAEDVWLKASKDAGVSEEHPGEQKLAESGVVSDVTRQGDDLTVTVTFTADHAATQEIGGRWQSKLFRGKHSKFIKYRHHPAGGKERFVGDALKTGVRKYRSNLKKVIEADLKAKHGAR